MVVYSVVIYCILCAALFAEIIILCYICGMFLSGSDFDDDDCVLCKGLYYIIMPCAIIVFAMPVLLLAILPTTQAGMTSDALRVCYVVVISVDGALALTFIIINAVRREFTKVIVYSSVFGVLLICGIVGIVWQYVNKPRTYNINMTVSGRLCEYDAEKHELGGSASNMVYGKSYALFLDGTFENTKLSDTLDCTVTVTIDGYDDSYNKSLITSGVFAGGVAFEYVKEGVYKYDFTLTPSGAPDISQCYFVISAKTESAKTGYDYGKVSVSFSAEAAKDNHHTYTVTLNGKAGGENKAPTDALPPVTLVKNKYTLAEPVYGYDLSTPERDIIIYAPERCKKVRFIVYADDTDVAQYCDGALDVTDGRCVLVLDDRIAADILDGLDSVYIRLEFCASAMYDKAECAFTYGMR